MTGIENVVVSTQHAEDVDNETIRGFITEEIIKPSLPSELLSNDTKYLINPTGRFVVGGPQGDSGLTGRKIIVDTRIGNPSDIAELFIRCHLQYNFVTYSTWGPGKRRSEVSS